MHTEHSDKVTKRELELNVLKALLKLDKDFFKKKEYEVHYVVPYDEHGGEIRGIISNFTAESSAEAVKYVIDKYDFPTYSTEEENEDSGYGIIKVRRINNEKIFTAEDMLRSWEYLFNNYSRELSIGNTGVKSNDNREEVLMSLVKLFNLPKRNKLTDKYDI